MSWPRKTAEGFCLPRASFSALTAKTSLKACIEVPWRVWSCLGEALETRKLHSESPSPGEEESSWVFQTPSAWGLHQYWGALRLGWVLAGPSASGNLCSHAEERGIQVWEGLRCWHTLPSSLNLPYFSLGIPVCSGCRDMMPTRLKAFREEQRVQFFFCCFLFSPSLFQFKSSSNIIDLPCVSCVCSQLIDTSTRVMFWELSF